MFLILKFLFVIHIPFLLLPVLTVCVPFLLWTVFIVSHIVLQFILFVVTKICLKHSHYTSSSNSWKSCALTRNFKLCKRIYTTKKSKSHHSCFFHLALSCHHRDLWITKLSGLKINSFILCLWFFCQYSLPLSTPSVLLIVAPFVHHVLAANLWLLSMFQALCQLLKIEFSP